LLYPGKDNVSVTATSDSTESPFSTGESSCEERPLAVARGMSPSMLAIVKGCASQGVALTLGIDRYASWPGDHRKWSGRLTVTRRNSGDITSILARREDDVLVLRRVKTPPLTKKIRIKRRDRSSQYTSREGQI
jgi:hypothetical protein